jgi:hypothetical protein
MACLCRTKYDVDKQSLSCQSSLCYMYFLVKPYERCISASSSQKVILAENW